MKITIPISIIIDDDYQLTGQMINELISKSKDKVDKLRFDAKLAPNTDIKFGQSII